MLDNTVAATPSAASFEPPRRPDLLRRTFLVLGPTLIIAGSLLFYLSGGGYVETANAYLRADKLAVSTDISGLVAEVAVREGQRIEAGELLFRLDDEPFRIALAAAEAELAVAMSSEANEAESGVHSAVYRQAMAKLESARRNLRQTAVTAPYAGVATNVAALQVGAFMSAGEPAFSLVKTDHIWVQANPKETDIEAIKVGSRAAVMVDAYPGRVWTAKVTAISPATGSEFSVLPAQNSSGNWVKVVQRVPVILELDATSDAPPLRSGMSASVEIETGLHRTLGGLFGFGDGS